jgi:hypothetical protein
VVVKRVMTVFATLALLGVGVAVVREVRDGVTEAGRFHPASFRAAVARGDDATQRDEARAAIEHRALHGRSHAEVRALLGEPDEIAGDGHEYVWNVNLQTGLFGIGDVQAFRVAFDPERGRVIDARFA